jgi:hypothetical protein
VSPPLESPPSPGYFRTRELDWMLHVVQAIAEETAVTRERLMSLEAVLAKKGLLAAGELDDYRPDAEEARERIAWHEQFTARLYAILEQAARGGGTSGV